MPARPAGGSSPSRPESGCDEDLGGGRAGSAGLGVAHVSKSFGATRALIDVSHEFAPGKVYALVGENGSGKSTLVKAVSGVLPPDSGAITVGGHPIQHFTPRKAMNLGVACCYQEVLVQDNLTALQNLFLWDRGWLRPGTRTADRESAGSAVLRELSSHPPDLDIRVAHLSLAARQLLVIARTLLQADAKVFLFDEVTASLDRSDSERVLEAIARRAKAGATVVVTTHRVEELELLRSETIVLRNGELAGVLSPDELTRPALLRLMSGRAARVRDEETADAVGSMRRDDAAPIASPPADGTEISVVGERWRDGERASDAVLRVGGVKLAPRAQAIDLAIARAEVTGFAGLDGQGQQILLEIMGGVSRPADGTIEVMSADGRWTQLKGQRHAVDLGVTYMPRDRKTQGIFPTLSVLENFALPTAGARSRGGLVNWRQTQQVYRDLEQRLAIKAASPKASVSSLSGGTQQKVLVARWLAAQPRVLLFDDPTRGVDIGTKLDLYEIFRRLAGEGRAVAVVSTELEELVTLCDRVVVLYGGTVTTDVRREGGSAAIDREHILRAMLGGMGAAGSGGRHE